MFHSLGEVEVYGLDRAQDVENALGARGQ
jgi:hypothetical protein